MTTKKSRLLCGKVPTLLNKSPDFNLEKSGLFRIEI